MTLVDKRAMLGLSPVAYTRIKATSAEIQKQIHEKPSMSFSEIARLTQAPTDIYCEFYKNKLFHIEVQNDTISLKVKTDDIEKLSENARLHLKALKDESWLMHLEFMAQIEVFGAGPKVFRPTAHQLFMLEKMNLNLNATEFQMPFKAIVLELPSEYVAARMTPTHKPFVSILYKDEVFIHSLWSSKYVVKSWWRPMQDDNPIENWFDGKYSEYVDPKSLPRDEGEGHMEQLVRRAALNYCLLLDEVGIKKEGPVSPNQYAQLVKWCQKNNKHTAANKIALQCIPMLYSIAGETQLVRMVDTLPKEEGEPTGRTVSPHCRRGHYRMQAYGPSSLLRKRIRIPPIMVNAKLLAQGLIPPVKLYKT